MSLGSLYTQTKSRDRGNLRALENHPMVIPCMGHRNPNLQLMGPSVYVCKVKVTPVEKPQDIFMFKSPHGNIIFIGTNGNLSSCHNP